MMRRRLLHHERQLQMIDDPVHNGIPRDESYIPLQVEHGIGLTSPLELPPIVEKCMLGGLFPAIVLYPLLSHRGVPFSAQDALGRAGERKTAMF